MDTQDESLRISDFLAGKPGNLIDGLILKTVRLKSWGEGFDTEDVIQNSRLSLIKNFRERKYVSGDLWAYVRRVAEIQCILEMKRHYRAIKHQERISQPALEAHDPAPGPLGLLLEEEKRGELIRILKELDKRCLQLILFKYHKGLSYKEIGIRLSLSESNAMVSVYRCLKKSWGILQKMEKSL